MKKSIQGLYLASLGALGTLAVVLRTVALLVGFDFSTGYFTDKLLNNVSAIIAAVAVVIFVTFLIYKKDYKPRVGIGTARDYVSSACVGVALIIMAFDIAATALSNNGVAKPQAIESMITAIAALLAAAAAFYFVFSVAFGKGAPLASATFSIALMLYLIFYALLLYFNASTPLNAPVKLCDQMAYAALSIFFVYETRISLARPMWRMYVVSGLSATLLSAYSAVPSLIVYFVRGEVISHTISETILTLSLFIFALVRTASALFAEEDRENRVVEFIRKMHTERTKEIGEARAARAHYNNNEENGEEENDNYEIELPKPSDNDGTERAEP